MAQVTPQLGDLPGRLLEKAVRAPEKAVQAVELRYVDGSKEGIRRHGRSRFTYYSGKRKVTEAGTLQRIAALAIPPAWTDVWICADPNGHLQATGIDAKGRKQYRYHARWSAFRSQAKFHRMEAFGKALPPLRRAVEKDLRLKGMPKEKVLAVVVHLMEQTHMRVGNRAYAEANGSFGLSTLKDRHLAFDGSGVRLRFKGKSGIQHDIPLRSRRLSRLALRCKELPGQELFQYVDGEEVHPVDSGMVNQYIRERSGGDFTSKDLRTWIGSTRCIEALLQLGPADTKHETTLRLNQAMDETARSLGNTRAVCRSHYVHPRVLELYEQGRLADVASLVRASRVRHGLSREEKVLARICHQAT